MQQVKMKLYNKILKNDAIARRVLQRHMAKAVISKTRQLADRQMTHNNFSKMCDQSVPIDDFFHLRQ